MDAVRKPGKLRGIWSSRLRQVIPVGMHIERRGQSNSRRLVNIRKAPTQVDTGAIAIGTFPSRQIGCGKPKMPSAQLSLRRSNSLELYIRGNQWCRTITIFLPQALKMMKSKLSITPIMKPFKPDRGMQAIGIADIVESQKSVVRRPIRIRTKPPIRIDIVANFTKNMTSRLTFQYRSYTRIHATCIGVTSGNYS